MSIKDRFLSPEETLIVAIIENAVQDAINPPPKDTRRIQLNATKWLQSESNAPYSFNWCMDILEMDTNCKKHICETIQLIKAQKKFNK